MMRLRKKKKESSRNKKNSVVEEDNYVKQNNWNFTYKHTQTNIINGDNKWFDAFQNGSVLCFHSLYSFADTIVRAIVDF